MTMPSWSPPLRALVIVAFFAVAWTVACSTELGGGGDAPDNSANSFDGTNTDVDTDDGGSEGQTDGVADSTEGDDGGDEEVVEGDDADEAAGDLILKVARGWGAGFEPPLDRVFTASVTADPNGVYYFSGTGVAASDEGGADCINGPLVDCLVVFDLADRTLSNAQVSELDALLEAVPEKVCEVDPGLACDPLFISHFEFNGRLLDPFCCGTVNEGLSTSLANIDLFVSELGGF